MHPVRVLIRAGSARDVANYRELIANGGALVPVADPSEADVILVILPGGGDVSAPLEGGPPVLALLAAGAGSSRGAQLEQDGVSVLSDGVSRAQLQAAIRAVANGLAVRDPATVPRPMRTMPVPGAEAEGLTPRERELLRFLGEGLGNREIAQALGLSDHTVKFHLHSIYTKLGVRSRTEAVSVAVRRGMLML
jgi:DNA-binding CsgD family transcriptional regulator